LIGPSLPIEIGPPIRGFSNRNAEADSTRSVLVWAVLRISIATAAKRIERLHRRTEAGTFFPDFERAEAFYLDLNPAGSV
jgi:hypothetical protein